MEVEWLPFASKQLKEIIAYITENFGENTAKKSLRKIFDRLNHVGRYPESGIWDEKFSTANITIRHLNIGPNIIFYLVDNDHLVVIAVMHSKQSPVTINQTISNLLTHYEK